MEGMERTIQQKIAGLYNYCLTQSCDKYCPLYFKCHDNNMIGTPFCEMDATTLDECWKIINEEKNSKSSPKTIKDSGDRTKFESGAVRDMHAGKGRYDLLPMCVIDRLAKHYEAGALKYSDRNWEKGIPAHSFADSAMRHFCKYMDGQNDEDHLIAAIWNLCGLAWTEVKRPEMMDIPARMEVSHEP